MTASPAKQTATVTAPAMTTTSALLLAASANRSMWFVTNTTAAVLYLRFGSAAATSGDYSVAIAAGGYYECPIPVYGGAVQGVLASGTGNPEVTAW